MDFFYPCFIYYFQYISICMNITHIKTCYCRMFYVLVYQNYSIIRNVNYSSGLWDRRMSFFRTVIFTNEHISNDVIVTLYGLLDLFYDVLWFYVFPILFYFFYKTLECFHVYFLCDSKQLPYFWTLSSFSLFISFASDKCCHSCFIIFSIL